MLITPGSQGVKILPFHFFCTGLATHELHFTIIREEFKPNQKRPCEMCGQIGKSFSKSCCYYLRCNFLIHDSYRQHYCKFTDQRHSHKYTIIFTSIKSSQSPFKLSWNSQFIYYLPPVLKHQLKWNRSSIMYHLKHFCNKNCLVFILTPFSEVTGHVMDKCMGLPKEKQRGVSFLKYVST